MIYANMLLYKGATIESSDIKVECVVVTPCIAYYRKVLVFL